MTTCIGCALLLGVLAGGVFLYFKVERLDREISRQMREPAPEGEDDNS